MINPNIQYLQYANFDDAESRGWNGAGWYFWDEVGQFCYGPHDSQGLAELALDEYAKTL